MRKWSKINGWVLLLAGLVGFVFGLGCYTVYYAEGLSYLSNDPKACANCHIMRDQYEGWQKASHHAAATCNDCHVPYDLVGKYFAKAENGYHHSKAFTLQDFHEPIMIKEKNSAILQQNCRRCHSEFVSQTTMTLHTNADKLDCVHCHQSVGHGALK
jgi:cytochrome c nitrite reductase small subunit